MNRKAKGGAPPAPERRGAAAEAKMDLLAELIPHLARAIAPNCEVALHDTRTSPPTIRAIGNGHVTGRGVGDKMTRVAVDGQEVEALDEPLFNYYATPNGNEVRTSLIPVRDGDTVIGYIAVNFLIRDLALARQVLSFLIGTEPHALAIKDPFEGQRSAASLVDDYLEELGCTTALLARAERIELIRYLHHRGAFAIRGAVEDVARKMGVSRTTIYNYLAEVEETLPAAGMSRSNRS